MGSDGREIYCGLVFFCGSSPQTVLLESIYPPDAWLDKDYVEEVGPGMALTGLLPDPALLSNNRPARTTLHVDCEPPYRTLDQVYSGRKVWFIVWRGRLVHDLCKSLTVASMQGWCTWLQVPPMLF